MDRKRASFACSSIAGAIVGLELAVWNAANSFDRGVRIFLLIILSLSIAASAGIAARRRGEIRWRMAAVSWLGASIGGVIVYLFWPTFGPTNSGYVQVIGTFQGGAFTSRAVSEVDEAWRVVGSLGAFILLGGIAEGWRVPRAATWMSSLAVAVRVWLSGLLVALASGFAGIYVIHMLGVIASASVPANPNMGDVIGFFFGFALWGGFCGFLIAAMLEPAIAKHRQVQYG